MAAFLETKVPHELVHPLDILLLLVRHQSIDRLDHPTWSVLQILAWTDVLVAAFRHVTGADQAEEAVEQALCNALSQVAGVDVELELKGEAPDAAFVAVVVEGNVADNLFLGWLGSAVAAVVHGDKEGQVLGGDIVDARGYL